MEHEARTSIATSPDLQLGGNEVIVAFQNHDRGLARGMPCDTARRAIMTIVTETLVNSVSVGS